MASIEPLYVPGTSDLLCVDEGESFRISLMLKDRGNIIDKASISSIVLTLLDKDTNEVINSRDAADVLDTGGGTLSDTGLFTLTFAPEDTALIDTTIATETHLIILTFSWTDEFAVDQSNTKKYSVLIANKEEAGDAVILPEEISSIDLSGIKRVKTKHMEIEAFDPRIIQEAKEKENSGAPCFGDLHFCVAKPKYP